MLKWISYPLSPQSPLYPGTKAISHSARKSMERGDSANTSILTLPTHAGSHIDAPLHFCPGGKNTREMLQDRLTLSPVYCIDIPALPSTAIRIPYLEPYTERIADARGLLLRTGMYRLRSSDPARYCNDHPWIHPEVPRFLQTACPSLHLFGTDTISISNPQFRSEGRECHRAFLCQSTPILLAEDLDLSNPGLPGPILSLSIYPLIVDDLDGVPILAFAEIP